eukprot:TRINITY_DN18067_c0_g1_i1.p1 TRINITY_DN18067_c0_g1~~TRINITY_DN18067_c0_g1_i1.p1  ORF type:complete len:1009 (+),score=245.34 TRINITY_DN18067_c0_g1_i1:108-3134(+)
MSAFKAKAPPSRRPPPGAAAAPPLSTDAGDATASARRHYDAYAIDLEMRESKSRRAAGHRAPVRAPVHATIDPERNMEPGAAPAAPQNGAVPQLPVAPPLAMHRLHGPTAAAGEKVRPEQQPKTSASSRPKSPRPDALKPKAGRPAAGQPSAARRPKSPRRSTASEKRRPSPQPDRSPSAHRATRTDRIPRPDAAAARTGSPSGLLSASNLPKSPRLSPDRAGDGGAASPRRPLFGAAVSPPPAAQKRGVPARGTAQAAGRKKKREPSGSAEHVGASPRGATVGTGFGTTCPPPDLSVLNLATQHAERDRETAKPARKKMKAVGTSPAPLMRLSPRELHLPNNNSIFKRTSTMPASMSARSSARSPKGRPKTPSGAETERTASVGVMRPSRLDEGIPVGIPSGLLPAAEMPPWDVMVDVVKRRDLLLRICQELEDSLPAHLKTDFQSGPEENKEASLGRKKGTINQLDPEEDPGDPRSRIKPVTSRFVRRILVLFYASRNAAEEQRLAIEAAIEKRGMKAIGEFPPDITCMHAAYNVIDSLVRIGHRRVLKILFGNLFWHVIDVLEWPPQVFGGKLRLQHRMVVKGLPSPDPTLVPDGQMEEVVKLHRLMYVQNSCLIRACDSVTYFHLNEFIETEKLRVLHDVLDANRYQPSGREHSRCFLASWAFEWAELGPRRDAVAEAQKHKLLASLMSVASCVWEHDKTAQFVQRMYSVGIHYTLLDVLADPMFAAQAAEVLALLASDFGAQEDIRQVFLGHERHRKTESWKKIIRATAAEGTHGMREMIHSILTKTTDMWDVMLYLKSLEECVSQGAVLQQAESVKNVCDSLNLVILPLRKVFTEVYGGRVVELLATELAAWLGEVERHDPEVLASLLRTLTLFIRIPVREACRVVEQRRVFDSLQRLVPRRDCLLRSAALSFARAVWWRADPSSSDAPDAGQSADMGSYIPTGRDEDDPRAALAPGATQFLERLGLSAMLEDVMHGQNTLCPDKHAKPGVRNFFAMCTQYE